MKYGKEDTHNSNALEAHGLQIRSFDGLQPFLVYWESHSNSHEADVAVCQGRIFTDLFS